MTTLVCKAARVSVLATAFTTCMSWARTHSDDQFVFGPFDLSKLQRAGLILTNPPDGLVTELHTLRGLEIMES